MLKRIFSRTLVYFIVAAVATVMYIGVAHGETITDTTLDDQIGWAAVAPDAQSIDATAEGWIGQAPVEISFYVSEPLNMRPKLRLSTPKEIQGRKCSMVFVELSRLHAEVEESAITLAVNPSAVGIVCEDQATSIDTDRGFIQASTTNEDGSVTTPLLIQNQRFNEDVARAGLLAEGFSYRATAPFVAGNGRYSGTLHIFTVGQGVEAKWIIFISEEHKPAVLTFWDGGIGFEVSPEEGVHYRAISRDKGLVRFVHDEHGSGYQVTDTRPGGEKRLLGTATRLDAIIGFAE